MQNAIQEELKDLLKQAEYNRCFLNNNCEILKQCIANGNNTLDDIETGKVFFAAIAFLNAQRKSPKIEQFIRKKLQHNPVNSTTNRGDSEKDGVYYEYKISTTNKNGQINALQIRLNQCIDYYLLGYIDEKQFTESRLYLVHKMVMEELCNKYGKTTHGTKDANYSNENVELSFRIEMKTKNEILLLFEQKYRATNLENQIFN